MHWMHRMGEFRWQTDLVGQHDYRAALALPTPQPIEISATERLNMERTPVKVSVNQDLCVGNAMCRAIAPRAFTASPNGKSIVADPDAEDIEALAEAADTCPVAAIEIERGPVTLGAHTT
jgi:ferredoxin